jgi:hypothetical protein
MSTPVSASPVQTNAAPLLGVPPRSLSDGAGFSSAVGNARAQLLRSGQLDIKVDTRGVNAQTLGRALDSARQNGSIDFNVSPNVFNIQTGSQAGTQIEAYAKELKIETKDKTVGQLVEEIGKKSLGNEAGNVFNSLPRSVQIGLGAAAVGAIAGTGNWQQLNALGIRASAGFDGGKLSVALQGNDRGPLLDFSAEAKINAGSGVNIGLTGRATTQGNVSGGVSVEASNDTVKFSGGVAGSNFPGEANFSAMASLGINLGQALLQGNAKYQINNGAGAFGGGASLGVPLLGGQGSINLQATPASGATPADTRVFLQYMRP